MSERDETDAKHWEAVEEATELLQEERYPDALYALRDVIQGDPSNAYAFYYLGVALFETAQLEPARDAFRAALRLAPGHLGARVALANVLRMLGDLRGAIREGEEALRRHPGDGDAMHALGLAHAGRGDREAARRYLEAFLSTKPELEAALEARTKLEQLGLGIDPVDFED
jgi:tetratricopeptide (TPR) repeat protein